MSLAGMLRTTVTLQKKVTANQGGGQVPNFAPVDGATCVPADVQSASGSTRRYYAENHLNVTHTVFVASDIGARKDMRVVHPDTGRAFKVVDYVPPSIGYDEWPGQIHVEEELLPS